MAVLLVVSYWLEAFMVCCGGKSKEGKVVPSNKVNTMDINNAQNDKELETMEEEEGREEQKQATSASMVEV